MSTRLSLFLAPLAFSLAAPLLAAEAPDLTQARSLLEAGEYKDAAKAFKKANQAAGGECFDCLLGLAAAYDAMARFDDAADAARLAAALEEPPERLAAANLALGEAILIAAGHNKKKLAEAESSFRKALELAGEKAPRARYRLAETLLKLGRDGEAAVELEKFLRDQPEGDLSRQARAWLENPRSAREKFAPQFQLATLDGDTVSLRDLNGKVVLLDFWATWCEPCIKALPDLKRLAKKKGEEPFELVSVSVDQDRGAVKAFVEKNEMSWRQCWDDRGGMSRALFGVTSYPSYLLLDPEGAVLFTSAGSSFRSTADLFSEVNKAIRKAKERIPPAKP